MNLPAGWIAGCSKCHGWGRVGSGRVGLGSVQNRTGRVESGHDVFKYRGSGRVGSARLGSRIFQISGVGSGPDKGLMRRSGVGSGHEPREAGHSRIGPA